jgi:hypothetical protein
MAFQDKHISEIVCLMSLGPSALFNPSFEISNIEVAQSEAEGSLTPAAGNALLIYMIPCKIMLHSRVNRNGERGSEQGQPGEAVER